MGDIGGIPGMGDDLIEIAGHTAHGRGPAHRPAAEAHSALTD